MSPDKELLGAGWSVYPGFLAKRRGHSGNHLCRDSSHIDFILYNNLWDGVGDC